MTVAEALQALHKAGRIRSPWLEGMAFGGSDGWGHIGRLTGVDGERFPYEWEYKGYLRSRADGHDWYELPPEPRCPPVVLTDPATVGCLLALLREASGDTDLHAYPWSYPAGSEWRCGPAMAGTEGEAIAAALIALAGAL